MHVNSNEVVKKNSYQAIRAHISLDMVLLAQVGAFEHHGNPVQSEAVAETAEECAVAVEDLRVGVGEGLHA